MSAEPSVKVALAQINATVGDLAGNVRRIVDAARNAYTQGARLVLSPELGVCGYPPEDLLFRPAFMQACAAAVQDCARALADLPGLFVVVGHPHQLGELADLRSKSWAVPQRCNAASVLSGGRVVATYCKRELPNYQVFDERRYFASGRDAGLGPVVFEVEGLRFGLNICEDAWFDEPALAAKRAGADVLCVLNASPFHLGKADERELRMAQRAKANAMPLLYSHLVGGQDEVVFDGASFALDARGEISARAPMFEEALTLLDVPGGGFNATTRVRDRWTPAHPATDVPRAGSSTAFFYGLPTTYTLQSGNHVRLSSAVLTARVWQRAAHSASVFLSGTNLLVISAYRGFDPNVSAAEDDPRQAGLDQGAYPVPRTISLGLRATL